MVRTQTRTHVTIPHPGPLSLFSTLESPSIAKSDFHFPLRTAFGWFFEGPYIFMVTALSLCVKQPLSAKSTKLDPNLLTRAGTSFIPGGVLVTSIWRRTPWSRQKSMRSSWGEPSFWETKSKLGSNTRVQFVPNWSLQFSVLDPSKVVLGLLTISLLNKRNNLPTTSHNSLRSLCSQWKCVSIFPLVFSNFLLSFLNILNVVMWSKHISSNHMV